MSSATNKKQNELLMAHMEQFPDIAAGFTKRNKEHISNVWEELETILNSAGPPIKTIYEWKKVWNDKKSYVKKKLAENMRNKNATSGETYKEHIFSATEESIIKMCAMKDSVEGCLMSSRIGLSSCNKKRHLDLGNEAENETTCFSDLKRLSTLKTPTTNSVEANNERNGNFDQTVMSVFNVLDAEDDQPQLSSNDTVENIQPKLSSKIGKSQNKSNLLEEEINMERNFCDKIDDVLVSIKNHQEFIEGGVNKIHRSIDRMYELQTQIFEETKRHNIAMENYRKLELDRRT